MPGINIANVPWTTLRDLFERFAKIDGATAKIYSEFKAGETCARAGSACKDYLDTPVLVTRILWSDGSGWLTARMTTPVVGSPVGATAEAYGLPLHTIKFPAALLPREFWYSAEDVTAAIKQAEDVFGAGWNVARCNTFAVFFKGAKL